MSRDESNLGEDPAREARGKRSRGKRRSSGSRARIDGNALVLGERRIPLLSGAVHYWRLDPSVWRTALESLRDLGFPIVETYIPWSPHEKRFGEYEFGETDPRLDVARFLDLAQELGLWVFARPGPHINAELTHFGIPERVIYDRACQARSPRQNPVILPWPPKMFPVPSYASRSYAREAGRWYDAVAKVLAPRRFPDGPIAMIQVDNEATFYFRNGPYDQDYHPDAVRLYRAFVEERYGSIDAAAAAYRTSFTRWSDVEPPSRFDARDPEELVRHLDWAEFQECLVSHAIGKFGKRLARSGLSKLPTVHNLPLGDGGLPVNMPALATSVDVVGLDYYHSAREHRSIKRRTLYLSGTFETVYAPEIGVGAPPWFTPLHQEDSLYCAMCALAYGLRGLNLYMAVDRDRWYGAPINSRGTPRRDAEIWRRLFHALRQVSFHELKRRAAVALQLPIEYRRLSRATHLLGGILSPSALEALGGTPVDGCREDDLGFKGPVQVLWWRLLAKVSDALTRAQIPYVYVDSEAPVERLTQADVVLSPSFEFARVSRFTRLEQAAEAGVKVLYGPTLPTRDERMAAHRFVAPPNSECIYVDTPEDADLLVERLRQKLNLERPFPARPSPIETSVHEDDSGPRVLFVMNPGRPAKTAHIDVPWQLTTTDVLTGERFESESGVVSFPMSGLTARMMIVSRPDSPRPESDKGPPRPVARRSSDQAEERSSGDNGDGAS